MKKVIFGLSILFISISLGGCIKELEGLNKIIEEVNEVTTENKTITLTPTNNVWIDTGVEVIEGKEYGFVADGHFMIDDINKIGYGGYPENTFRIYVEIGDITIPLENLVAPLGYNGKFTGIGSGTIKVKVYPCSENLPSNYDGIFDNIYGSIQLHILH